MTEQWKNHRGGFLGVGIATILAAGACVALGLVLQYVIDYTLNGRVKDAVVISVLFLTLLIVVLLTQSIGLVVLNQNMMKQIRAGIVEKILRKSYLDFGKYKDSDYISLLTNDMKKIEDTYIPTLFTILMEVVQLVFAIVIMTRYSWVFTVVMLAMTILMFLVPTYFSEKCSGLPWRFLKVSRLLHREPAKSLEDLK